MHLRVRSVIVASLFGCAAEEEIFPTEAVTQPEWDVALALVRQDDAVLAARATRLDRIDQTTGTVTRVAGAEWAECPTRPGRRWGSTVLDFTYPNLLVRGSRVYLVNEACGLWFFDTATGERRMLVDPTVHVPQPEYEVGQPLLRGSWNGQPGPNWLRAYEMALAYDGDSLVACFPVTDGEGGDFRQHVELWALDPDSGAVREKLAKVSPDDGNGTDYCTHVLADDSSILFSTERSILRWDRTTRSLARVASGLRFGPAGLAQDASAVYYIGQMAEIVRVPRDGSPPATLRPAVQLTDPPRMMLTIDGDQLYFHEGKVLKRMSTAGAGIMDLTHPTETEWTLPMTLGIGSEHVYFQTLTNIPEREEVEPTTGETIRVSYVGALRRARK